MSSRARRLDVPVARFSWGQAHVEPARPAAAHIVREPAPPRAVLREPAPPTAEQEAHLAALERDAFAKGFAQGERAGVEAGMKRTDAALRRVGETLQELGALRAQIIRQSERQLVQLALALARRIVRREVQADDEFLVALTRVAVDRLQECGPATVRLNPEDFARIAPRQIDEWTAGHVTVVADPAVSRGGCLVDSALGFVDAGIDAQFQELTRALIEVETAGLEVPVGV